MMPSNACFKDRKALEDSFQDDSDDSDFVDDSKFLNLSGDDGTIFFSNFA